MSKKIVIIQGHPHTGGEHLCHALADAYAFGAREAGFSVETIDVGALEFPILRDAEDWMQNDTPDGLKEARGDILNADHLVIFYPLWLGTMPALLKAFLEQAIRPDAGMRKNHLSELRKLLKGKSARIVVTMGMPAIAYSLFYRKHSVKSLQRNILAFTGVGPIFTKLIGLVDNMSQSRADKLMSEMTTLGRAAR